ncbi:MAG: hypothetical protein WC340_02725 [Kiritimatiellia bacterium]|jgi:hypothetical protein
MKLLRYVIFLIIFPCLFTIASNFNLEGANWKTYSTKGSEKSFGLTINTKYPDTWKMEDGNHPHIVQKWSTTTKSEKYTCMVSIKPASFMQILRIKFTNKGFDKVIGGTFDNQPNVRLISKKKTLIEQLPAYIFLTYQEGTRLDKTYGIYSYNLITYFNDCTIVMHFGGMPSSNLKANEETFCAAMKPVFMKFANSLVINPKWD